MHIESSIHVRKFKVYPNNKPCITKELKGLLKQKQDAFSEGDSLLLKDLQKKIQKQILCSKAEYKRKLDLDFRRRDSKAAWKKMQTITGYKKGSQNLELDTDFINELCDFYSRFDTHDFSVENIYVFELLNSKAKESSNDLLVNVHDVRNLFARAKVNKAYGPDGISNKVLRVCSQQLADVFTGIFQTCLNTGDIRHNGNHLLLFQYLK